MKMQHLLKMRKSIIIRVRFDMCGCDAAKNRIWLPHQKCVATVAVFVFVAEMQAALTSLPCRTHAT